MSLILDALKKSEQERRRERGPDLQTIHQATSTTMRAPRKSWPWLALVIVNVAAVSVWWWFQREPLQIAVSANNPIKESPDLATIVEAPRATATQPVHPPGQQFVAPSVQQLPQQSMPQTTQQTAQDEAQFTRIEPSATIAPPHVNATTPVEEFTDLPADVRSSLPAMTFSFHVYSAAASNRTIIINNQRLREGEQVSAGVVLESITEDGVILAMDHRRVHINVLTGW